MSLYAPVILYAYRQLGLREGSSSEEIENVLNHATNYKFFTKPRLTHVRRFTEFFAAWNKLGSFDAPYAEIRKSYHQYAKDLHPDKHEGDKKSEEHLKEINIAYALIESMNKEAKDYFKQSEKVRSIIEQKARQATENETPHTTQASDAKLKQASRSKSSARKYMAAPIPRPIRIARLGYLPLHTIIGNIILPAENGISQIFDIVMLPEQAFMRAKSYLSNPSMSALHLQYGKSAQPYILHNIPEITAPLDESDPEDFAINYFSKLFGLKQNEK